MTAAVTSVIAAWYTRIKQVMRRTRRKVLSVIVEHFNERWREIETERGWKKRRWERGKERTEGDERSVAEKGWRSRKKVRE